MRFSRDKNVFAFSPESPRIATIRPGDVFEVETEDCFWHQITTPDAVVTLKVGLEKNTELARPWLERDGKVMFIASDKDLFKATQIAAQDSKVPNGRTGTAV